MRVQDLIIYSSESRQVFNLSPVAMAFYHHLQEESRARGESEMPRPTPSSVTSSITDSNGEVFVSYSHQDAEWLSQLQRMLKPLTRRHKITLWDDTKIDAGANWKREIEAALSRANVAVMLVSSHFLASDFIAEHELPPLLKAAEGGGVTILWILVSDCLYAETELADFQAAHLIARPLDSLTSSELNTVLKQICQKIATAANSTNPR